MNPEQTIEGDVIITGQATILGGIDNTALTTTITKIEQTTVVSQQAAAGLSTLIADISNDNLITPSEKKELKRTWEGVKAEYPKVLEQANTRGIALDAATRLAYMAAYLVLLDEMETGATPILGDMSANSVIVGATFVGQWASYYQTRQELQGAIEGETVGKTEYLTGFTTGGGTLTPTAPTLAGSCLFQTAYLGWNAQTGLTGQITHKIYRATAVGGPYTAIAEVSAYLYQDSGLALAGTADEPTPKAYWYKVSRVVNGATESAASSAVMITASPIPTGSIEAASIKAIKVDLENLFAQAIKVNAGGTFRSGNRYDTDGDVVDSNAAGVFIGSNGTLKAADSDGSGFEMVPGAGAKFNGVDLELTESDLKTFSGSGDDRHELSHEETSLVWRQSAEDGDPIPTEIARIGYDATHDKVLMDEIYGLVNGSPVPIKPLAPAPAYYGDCYSSLAANEKLPFTTQYIDSGVFTWDAANRRLYFNSSGLYRVATRTTVFALSARYNNDTFSGQMFYTISRNSEDTSGEIVKYFNAGDYITIVTEQSTAESTHLTVFKLEGATGGAGPTGPAGPQGDDGPEGPAGANGVTVPDISGLAVIDTVDPVSDRLIIFDSSAGQHKSVAPEDIGGVPIGFVYFQGPSDMAPSDLWPGTTWSNVSSEEAGLFRRSEGGSAATFGSTQTSQNLSHNHGGASGGMSANASHSHTIQAYRSAAGSTYDRADATPYTGTPTTITGISTATISHTHSISTDGGTEARPVNVTVRKWRRTA